ncbi:hypothetical protein AAG906_006571 [Vitis piasezkii]
MGIHSHKSYLGKFATSAATHLNQGTKDSRHPKVSYPTLIAFAEFVSEFDMPTDLSLKKKDLNGVEMEGLSPAMFEGVLKNFTQMCK